MIKRLLLLLIRFYRRFISPMHAPCCPFTPTCSTYAMQAIERHGAIYGSYLAIRRLLSGRPFPFYTNSGRRFSRPGKSAWSGTMFWANRPIWPRKKKFRA